ncbi:MAG: hypothetical protein QOG23_3263 [Blastocatellia bacterium]|jgi:hypothetical protein|nr:hypothetical protein [Blastocatellia bacterium]
MATNYLYLDDENPQTVEPYTREVERHVEGLRISLHPPKSYKERMNALRQDKFDGVILDLRLDQFVNWEDPEGERADYRATTLAQEIRTRATEGKFKDCPLVLWSTDSRLKASFNRDGTGQDLFDLKCVKDEILVEEKAKEIAERLVSLVSGYKQIDKIKGEHRSGRNQLFRFFGFKSDVGFLDPRIAGEFATREGPVPVHEYARFLIFDLLETAGPLIDERTLAARLGVDVDSSNDFQKLKDTYFKQAKYKGPFSSGWPRWWSYLVEERWLKLKGNPGRLRSMPASQRVEILGKALGLKKLVVAKPIKKGYSERFWTVCRATGFPLDPLDGLIVQTRDSRVWQDKPYVSMKAALDGTMEEQGLKIDPTDQERLNRVRVANPK